MIEKSFRPLRFLLAGLTLTLTVGCAERRVSAPAPLLTEPAMGMELVLIPAGCFEMGDPSGEGDPSERPVHEVCVDAFYLGRYEVTQGQWRSIAGENPSSFNKGEHYPVDSISWNDARNFLQQLRDKTGLPYRLPTEAEWEYACRSGGRDERYCGGNDVAAVAWIDRTGGGSTQPVGSKQANGLGLYDMSGNLWEWCSDRYDRNYYAHSPRTNPAGPGDGENFVRRGGSWSIGQRFVRATTRGRLGPDERHYSSGVRIALPAGQQP